MKKIQVLDVTLRDGGCVNDFNFGQAYMDRILDALEQSGIEFIELGYIDQKKGTESGRTQFCDEQVIEKHFLKNKKEGITYVAMMDYGKFDVDKFHQRSESGIDGIRLAFHKKDRMSIVEVGRKIIDKGYKFFVQPMITLRYSDKELLDLIEMVNNDIPDASGFYIVDSFGEMRPNDMERVLNLVDHNLNENIPLGFHSHNNLQMSYSNAVQLLQFPTNRELMLDSSIMGMGKGAGNLNTELLLEHMNLFYGKKYNVFPLLEVIDKVINQIHSEFYWGYAVEYYLSSINHCTPSYAGHFYNKHMLSVGQVSELLGMIAEEKKISFDSEYAEELYREYNARKELDDEKTIKELKEEFANKTVLLIAPGKSIRKEQDKINAVLGREDVISISLNHFNMFNTDYVFITREDVFGKAYENRRRMIVTSNISTEETRFIKVLDYKKRILVENGTQDSSGIIILNILKEFNLERIILAGFDGFSTNINKNYYDRNMRHPVTVEQAASRNKYFAGFVMRVREKVPVDFLTKSLYEEVGADEN